MAKVTLDEKTLVKSFGQCRLPRNRYVLRKIAESFGPSKSSGNPMITREWELIAPEVITVDGATVTIGGATAKQYLTLKVTNKPTPEENAEGTGKALSRYADEQKKLGLPYNEVDDENPALDQQPLIVDAICSSEEQASRMEPTDEQKAKREPGSIIKDGEGNDVIRHTLKIEQILGLSADGGAAMLAGEKKF